MMHLSYAMRGELQKILPHDTPNDTKDTYATYQTSEQAKAVTALQPLDIILTPHQAQLSGERFLLSGRKLVLTGTTDVGEPVIVKFSTDPTGQTEITHEHTLAQQLHRLDFAAHTFQAPRELAYARTDQHTLRVTEFLNEPTVFANLSIESQFTIVLDAFKRQAGLHAATYGHIRQIKKLFGLVTANEYLSVAVACQTVLHQNATELMTGFAVDEAQQLLQKRRDTIDLYCGFLTHTDFVPHNFRIISDELYLLDQTALHFGNKHEGWARLINYLVLYNPPLAQHLIDYISTNRAPEEVESLKLMRLYKNLYLLAFYTNTHQKTTGKQQSLSALRIAFWGDVLTATLHNTLPEPAVVTAYQTKRDELRDDAEKDRQRSLGQL